MEFEIILRSTDIFNQRDFTRRVEICCPTIPIWNDAGGVLGDEVVDFVAGDGDFSKFVWGEGRGEDDFAVDIGGVGFGAGGGRGIDQNTKLLADEGGGALGGNFLLGGHSFAVAGFFDGGRNLVGHFGGAASRFLGVGKDAHSIELGVLDKAEEGIELGIGLAREADDEGGANGEVGDSCA